MRSRPDPDIPFSPLAFVVMVLLTTFAAGAGAAPAATTGPPAGVLDVHVVAQTTLRPGTEARVRFVVQEARSPDDSRPLAAAAVVVLLDGDPVWRGGTDQHGVAVARIPVPIDAGDSDAQLRATVTHGGREEQLARTVRIERYRRVLLTVDKPRYQPGQTIHVRALALDGTNRRPLAGEELTLEVIDPNANTIFRKRAALDGFGVGAADCELADVLSLGRYRVRAAVGGSEALQTVEVARYVLPKFALKLDTDRDWYRPGDTVRGTASARYFFGEPVADAQLQVLLSVQGVRRSMKAALETKTDAEGMASFELPLPSFVAGQPVAGGDGVAAIEVTATDPAGQKRSARRSITVTERALRVTVVPESGKLVRGVDNRLLLAVSTPDGRPVQGEVELVRPFTARTRTDGAGLATVTVPARVLAQLPALALHVRARADDGASATLDVTLPVGGDGTGLLLRPSRALVREGETLGLDVYTGLQTSAVFVDAVRSAQTVATWTVPLVDGHGHLDVPIGPAMIGTVELHAWALDRGAGPESGSHVRDTRLVQVSAAAELDVRVEADRAVYRPGGEARLTFRVRRPDGTPAHSAVGLRVVDEALHSMTESTPGMARVFFELAEELLTPHVELHGDALQRFDLAELLARKRWDASNQTAAAALLHREASMMRSRWVVDPTPVRRARYRRVRRSWHTLLQRAIDAGHQPLVRCGETTCLDPDFYQRLVAEGFTTHADIVDPWGRPARLDELAERWDEFSLVRVRARVYRKRMDALRAALDDCTMRREGRGVARYIDRTGGWHARVIERLVEDGCLSDEMARAPDPTGRGPLLDPALLSFHRGITTPRQFVVQATERRLERALIGFGWWAYRARKSLRTTEDGAWRLPRNAMHRAIKRRFIRERWLKDPFGVRVRVEPALPEEMQSAWDQLRGYRMVSAGPDRQFGTEDDVRLAIPVQEWNPNSGVGRGFGFAGVGAGGGGGGVYGRALVVKGGGGRVMGFRGRAVSGAVGADVPGKAAAIHVREWFPETLLWQPRLITDAAGNAELTIPLADSITTWRLDATASDGAGRIGEAQAPIRVFQPFFVDLDLPVSLTQGDEVAVPVAVHNHLDRPQTVRLTLRDADWFQPLGGTERELEMEPNEVRGVSFPVEVDGVGRHAFTVEARGGSLSDAVRREVDVVPDGRRVEKTESAMLAAHTELAVDLPKRCAAEASRLFLRVQPGPAAEILSGLEGLLRQPHGCFEQTTTTTYPNVLVLDYLDRTRQAAPEIRMKAERFIHLGYQRLVSFEVKGGGFEWFGRDPAHVILTAYGLQQFTDMARVVDIDRAPVERAKQWLLSRQDSDGGWTVSRTHTEHIRRLNNRLLVTAYVAWSLAATGEQSPALERALAFVRDGVTEAPDDPYLLALAANALLTAAPESAPGRSLVERLLRLGRPDADGGLVWAPKGATAVGSGGASGSVETTALVALALSRDGRHTSELRRAARALVRMRAPSGAWSSTQGTVLALKALLTMSEQPPEAKHARLVVRQGETEAATLDIAPDASDLTQIVDLSDHVACGRNAFDLELSGDLPLTAQLVGQTWTPWPQQGSPPAQSPVSVDVAYDDLTLSQGDRVRVHVTVRSNLPRPLGMVVVDIGIPPGFTLERDELESTVRAGTIALFEQTERQLTLYLDSLAPNATVRLSHALKARFPLRAKTPASHVWEYYDPDTRGTSPPQSITVE